MGLGQLYTEYPDGIQIELLLRDPRYASNADVRADQIVMATAFVDAIYEGVRLEQAGQGDDAIELYEELVALCCQQNFPYTRLRVIYTKQKRFEDALRVCKSFREAIGLLADALEKNFAESSMDQVAGLRTSNEMVREIAGLEKKLGQGA